MSEAKELLWENVEQSLWWEVSANLEGIETDFEKVRVQHQYYHPALISFKTSFMGTVLELPEGMPKTVLQYGAGRRLLSIYAAINRLAQIAYPDRIEVCTEDEQRELDDSLLILYISMPAFFDALSLSLFHKLSPAGLQARNANIFDRKFTKAVDLPDLRKKIIPFSAWHKRMNEELRHRYAHRVPPYVPSSELDDDDQKQLKILQQEYSKALATKQWDALSEIMDRQRQLGKFCPKIYFFEENSWMPLQSTVFDDVLRFQYVAMSVFEEILISLDS